MRTNPDLVSYGPQRMLPTWESGSSMAAQIYDSDSGQAVGGQFTIDLPGHSYQAFKAYPAAGSTNTSIRIGRVMPGNN